MNKKGIATSLVLAIIFGLSTIGMGTYIVFDNAKPKDQISCTNNTESTTEQSNEGSQINEESQITESSNGLKDENQEKRNIIEKLMLEKMPFYNVDGDYKINKVYINNIEIVNEAYAATMLSDSMGLEAYKHYSDDNPNGENARTTNLNGKTIEAIGDISFTVEFDNEETLSRVIWAGSSFGGGNYKSSFVTGRHFYLYKTPDGKYELELVTGW